MFPEDKMTEKISPDQLTLSLKEATIRRKGSSKLLFDE